MRSDCEAVSHRSPRTPFERSRSATGTPFYFWGMTAILRGEIDRDYLFMHRSVKEN